MLEFAGRFSDPNDVIKQFKYWTVVYRECTTLGNVVIVLNRECPDFSHLEPREMEEFPKVCKWFEDKTKALYGAVKFNYMALMMRENFVHFHVLPRYDKPVEKYGMTFVDEDWPKRSSMGKVALTDEVKQSIIRDMRD